MNISIKTSFCKHLAILLMVLVPTFGLKASGSDSLWISLSGCDQVNKETIMRQAMALNFSQSDSILRMAEQFLQVAEKEDCKFQIAVINHIMGRAELRKTNLSSAARHFEHAYSIYSELGDSINMVRTLGSIGTIQVEWGMYFEAISMLKRALGISERNNYNYLTSRLLNNIGLAAHKNKEYSLALKYYHSALEYKLKDEDQNGLANTYTNIGEIYTEINDPTNAWLFINKGLNIRQLIKDQRGIAQSYFSLGKYYHQTEDIQKAIDYVEKAINLSHQENDRYNETYATSFLGELYMSNNQPVLALETWNIAIDLSKQLKLNILEKDLYSKVTQQLLADKKFEEASFLLMRMTELQDSILSDFKTPSPFQLQLSPLNETNKDQENTSHLKMALVLTLIGSLLTVLILAFFLNKLSRDHKRKMEIKNQEISNTLARLALFNQKLDQEVESRTAALKAEMEERKKVDFELKKTLKKVEDANFLKNAFLANMSHEIRTPLNGIIGFSSLLETELSLLENKELYDYASGILESGERLLHLLNNLIDISRLEANDMEVTLAPCEVESTINQVAELHRFKANELSIKFNVIPSSVPMVLADKKNLMRVLSNVIDNAIKYTEKGFINISTGTVADTKEVFIRVKDTGIGIDNSYIPHLFEAFRQESLGYSRAYQGAGLGLPLAKRLLELMKGRILVESEKAAGTVVTIFLKQITADPTLLKTSDNIADTPLVITSKAEIPLGEKHIFIVEDDRMNRLVLLKMLQNTANIESASDGEETLQMIKAAYNKGIIFNLMLFDINLPIPWDGTLLMKEIRKTYHEYKKVPFVAQTAYAMSGDRERLLEAGFDDYISKPISKNLLLKTVEKYLV